ncbi:MAG TPA: hypothetical protein EYQ61_07395 [Dehalococcoidia bacterium]|nr:hypothetical protein [Dehalococcoidia bacterium]HIK88446.1 hypothetical protein [Dehalococcoidia bacterium]
MCDNFDSKIRLMA